LQGSEVENIALKNLDEVVVHRNLAEIDPPTVFIHGEVANPGQYPLGLHMTASQLIDAAGGLLRGAYTQSADLSRYTTHNGQRVESEVQNVNLASILAGDKSADVPLRDGDVLSVRQISGWQDIGASITIRGEVNHPGTYGIRIGERLSSVLKRAGGFEPTAYPQGSVFTREQVRDIEQKGKDDLIERLQEQQFSNFDFGTGSNQDANNEAQLQKAFILQQQQVIAGLKAAPVEGRMVLRISPDLKRWQNTPEDIEVRDGDVITIPKRPDFVVVTGEVYSPNAITLIPGRNTAWYLGRAGGTTELANRKNIYVIRANGAVIGRGSRSSLWWGGNVMSMVLQPGDTVVVPTKVLLGNTVWKHLVDSAQVLGSLAIAGRVASSF
jgi:protein involved in polysaccharide export with SLBB domain